MAKKKPKVEEFPADLLIQIEAPFEVVYDNEGDLSPEDSEGEELGNKFYGLKHLQLVETNYEDGDESWEAIGSGWFRTESSWPFEIREGMSITQIDKVIKNAKKLSKIEGGKVTEVWLITKGKPTIELLNLRLQKEDNPRWREITKGDRQSAKLALTFFE